MERLWLGGRTVSAITMDRVILKPGSSFNDGDTYLPWLVSSERMLSTFREELGWAFHRARYVADQIFGYLPIKTGVQVLIFEKKSQMTVWCSTNGIVIPPGVKALTNSRYGVLAPSLDVDLVHELIHSVTNADFPACPVWLNEIISNYFQMVRRNEKGEWFVPPHGLAWRAGPLLLGKAHWSIKNILLLDNYPQINSVPWFDRYRATSHLAIGASTGETLYGAFGWIGRFFDQMLGFRLFYQICKDECLRTNEPGDRAEGILRKLQETMRLSSLSALDDRFASWLREEITRLIAFNLWEGRKRVLWDALTDWELAEQIVAKSGHELEAACGSS
jgi:hypothetical protein